MRTHPHTRPSAQEQNTAFRYLPAAGFSSHETTVITSRTVTQHCELSRSLYPLQNPFGRINLQHLLQWGPGQHDSLENNQQLKRSPASLAVSKYTVRHTSTSTGSASAFGFWVAFLGFFISAVLCLVVFIGDTISLLFHKRIMILSKIYTTAVFAKVHTRHWSLKPSGLPQALFLEPCMDPGRGICTWF